ncbi:hypothetical protein ACFGVR_16735 [Mucilaginibacter sp. AW1-3]
MKTFKTRIYPSAQALHQYMAERLNELFEAKIQKDVAMQVTQTDYSTVEIGHPKYYESFLYKMIVKGSDIQLIKSEHYVDDVYNLALEDIVLTLIEKYIGQDNLETIEGEISG